MLPEICLPAMIILATLVVYSGEPKGSRGSGTPRSYRFKSNSLIHVNSDDN